MQQVPVGGILQQGLQFGGAGLGGGQVPLGWQTGMDHGEAETLVVVEQRLVAQPEEEFLAIMGLEDTGQGILFAEGQGAGGRGREMQVVVAQDADGGVTQATHKAQQAQGVRPAIDQIARKPEAIDGGIEVDAIEEAQQVIEAALDIANGIGGADLVQRRPLVQGEAATASGWPPRPSLSPSSLARPHQGRGGALMAQQPALDLQAAARTSPAKPPSPSLAMTRWQGTAMRQGLARQAPPMARALVPSCRARSP